MGVTGRYVLRCALHGVSAAQASLLTAALADGIQWGDWQIAGLLAVGASLAYAGIGAASKQVEPSIANKL